MTIRAHPPTGKAIPAPREFANVGEVAAYLRQLYRAIVENNGLVSNYVHFGLDGAPSANEIPGVNAGNTAWEYKEIAAGTGVSVTHSTGTITLAGTNTLPYRAITALRTLDTTDCQIECTSGTFTVTLPTAVGITGRIYSIKNSGTGVITVACNGAQTIDASATQTLNTYDNMVVMSNNANWIVV